MVEGSHSAPAPEEKKHAAPAGESNAGADATKMSNAQEHKKTDDKKSGFLEGAQQTLKPVSNAIQSIRHGFQKMLPDSVRENATRISNAGLMTFTSVMLLSSVHGKKIGQQLYDKQVDMLRGSGLEGEKLTAKIAELTKAGVIKAPKFHLWRLAYLGTAITSFAIGMLIKEKPEPKEELEKYDKMSLPQYMGTRLAQSLDPINHSRQTVSAVGLASGGLAIVSALTQPGGVHRSEAYAAATLLAGFSSLMFIKDSDTAHQWFSSIWWTRLPLIISGTNESVFAKPKFRDPLKPIDYNPKAPDAFLSLDKPRMDISYPIGQWGNYATAIFGFLAGSGRGAKKVADATPASTQTDTPPQDNAVTGKITGPDAPKPVVQKVAHDQVLSSPDLARASA